MRLWLVRHGSIDDGRDVIEERDYHLVPEGKREARLLAKKLAPISFTKIYCSTLSRARETCAPYVVLTKRRVIYDERLKEIYRTLVGGSVRKGTPLRKVAEDRKRIESFYRMIIKRKGDVLVFCHGNVIRYLLAKVLEVNPKNFYYGIVISYCSLTVINIEKKKKEILMVNYPLTLSVT